MCGVPELVECIHLFNCGHLLGQSLAKSTLTQWPANLDGTLTHLFGADCRHHHCRHLCADLYLTDTLAAARQPCTGLQASRGRAPDAALSGALKLELGIVGTMSGGRGFGCGGVGARVLCN